MSNNSDKLQNSNLFSIEFPQGNKVMFKTVMFKTDEREIFALYKGKDSDQIYGIKKGLISSAQGAKFSGIGLMILGVPTLLLVIGFILIPIGFIIWKKGEDSITGIEEATAKYCQNISIEPV